MDYSDDSEIPGSSCQNEESGRGCRNRKKQNEQTCCPVCSVTLRQNEIDMHLNSEIERLNKLPTSKHKHNGRSNPSSSSSSDSNPDKNWETYQKVRSNRQTRQRTKTRKRKPEDACPICNREVNEDLAIHVEKCLRRSEANGSSSDENIDVEAFEEYEWAGQSRVRATSLLQGGVSNLGTSISMGDEDEDLNVDGDDTQMYGSPQYSENDVILPCEDPDPEDVALRKAVIGGDPKRLCTDKDKNSEAKNSEDPVVEVLKNRIRELESKEQNREVYKCLICMERYHTPVISVCCWHVHCEECWLQTLGAKKLCPQCNMITSPADLRRIYM
nr:unnamed protein product [Callosobruchus analis]